MLLSCGRLFGLEGRHHLHPSISISLQADYKPFNIKLADSSASTFQSYVLVGDYYTGKNRKDKLFIGVGTGYYVNGQQRGENSQGIMGRLGYQYNNTRLSASYHYMLKDDSKQGYIGFSISYNLLK